MATMQFAPVLPYLRGLVTQRHGDASSDQQLLQRFASENNQEAFATIVQRHGPLVLRVCGHVLQNAQDAEDCFQATFLVLARKAGSIRKQRSLASWLHGVAYRMSMKAKRDAARRRNHERIAGTLPPAKPTNELTWREAQAILDEEIERLPEKYRTPFLLCCLESEGRADVAAKLGIKEGTLSSRLAFARQCLQKRLARRGVTLAVTLAASTLATPSLSAAQVYKIAYSAIHFSAGHASSAIVSANVGALAREALHGMFLAKAKSALLVAITVSLLTVATGAVGSRFGLTDLQAASKQSDAEVAAELEDSAAEPAANAQGDGIFRDITPDSGVRFTYRNGEEAGQFTLLESLGGGVGVIDFDGDGLLDLFFPGGGQFTGPDKKVIRGHPCKLYKNLGRGKFKDVTKETGLDRIDFYTHGVAVTDYDCDGWPDLLVTGWQRLALFHNESDGQGGRKFVDVTANAGLPAGLWSTSAAFADLNGDGFPDLYVCQYVDWSFDNNPPIVDRNNGMRHIAPPGRFKGLPHKLFRNNGDGTFSDISKAAGLRQIGERGTDAGKGLGVVIADINNDGKPDIYVANDTIDNFLYINRGNGRFEEIGMRAGVARDDRGVPNGSKGIAVGDFDSSGLLSLFVTNHEHEDHALYKNHSNIDRFFFSFITARAGIAAIGQRNVGWGTAFFDFDGDGMLDIVIVNGHVQIDPRGLAKRKQRPHLLRNLGNGKFADVTPQGGAYFLLEHNARGLAVVDLDNDGWPDIIISHVNEPVVILRNQGVAAQHRWIGFELAGKKSRDIVGAKVVVKTNARTLTSFAHGGGSYLSSSDRRHLFGLGLDEDVQRISVYWPGGATQHWDNLTLNRYWRLTEGGGAVEMTRP